MPPTNPSKKKTKSSSSSSKKPSSSSSSKKSSSSSSKKENSSSSNKSKKSSSKKKEVEESKSPSTSDRKRVDVEKKCDSPRVTRGGFNKTMVLSPELSKICGEKELPRAQIVRVLWQYASANGLRNPDNQREIICDKTLKKVFKTDTIDSLKLYELIGQHVTPR